MAPDSSLVNLSLSLEKEVNFIRNDVNLSCVIHSVIRKQFLFIRGNESMRQQLLSIEKTGSLESSSLIPNPFDSMDDLPK